MDALPIGRRELARTLVLFAAAAALLSCAGCAERRAERALDAALAEAATAGEGDREVRRQLEAIVARWPKTKAAARARRELEWLDDFESAAARGPALRAWDAVREVARAVERFRIERGHYPRDLRELHPRYLETSAIDDPWGHPIRYERRRDGYRVICYGADGLPGGTGEASDLLVANGEAVAVGGAPR